MPIRGKKWLANYGPGRPRLHPLRLFIDVIICFIWKAVPDRHDRWNHDIVIFLTLFWWFYPYSLSGCLTVIPDNAEFHLFRKKISSLPWLPGERDQSRPGEKTRVVWERTHPQALWPSSQSAFRFFPVQDKPQLLKPSLFLKIIFRLPKNPRLDWLERVLNRIKTGVAADNYRILTNTSIVNLFFLYQIRGE